MKTLPLNQLPDHFPRWLFHVLWASTLGFAAVPAVAELRVDSNFSNGSGRVLSIDPVARAIRLDPSQRPGRGWVCWWYIKVTGIRPGETVTVEVGEPPWATPARAAFSLDNQRWRHTAAGQRGRSSMVYRQRVDAEQAWFAWGPPFTTDHAQQVVQQAADRLPEAVAIELCRTREGRAVPALRIRGLDPQDERRPEVWVQARQHAWEAGSSWVCAGFVDWLSSTDQRAIALRTTANLTVVPVMDMDSVAIGAGGKNQSPHDHNRDWGGQPHWPSVEAAMQRIREMEREGVFALFIDLHNPGPRDRSPFFYVTPRRMLSSWRQRNLDRFLAAARQEIAGPLIFRGETRESDRAYDKNWERISKNWVSMNTAEHVVAVTLETSWNTEHSDRAGYESVGRQLGRTVQRYLQTGPRTPP